MSKVTGVVLCMSVSEKKATDDALPRLFNKINRWLADRGFEPLRFVQDSFGGGMDPQMLVAGGGYNYLPDDEFTEFVLRLSWECPEELVLLMNSEHCEQFKVYRPHRY